MITVAREFSPVPEGMSLDEFKPRMLKTALSVSGNPRSRSKELPLTMRQRRSGEEPTSSESRAQAGGVLLLPRSLVRHAVPAAYGSPRSATSKRRS